APPKRQTGGPGNAQRRSALGHSQHRQDSMGDQEWCALRRGIDEGRVARAEAAAAFFLEGAHGEPDDGFSALASCQLSEPRVRPRWPGTPVDRLPRNETSEARRARLTSLLLQRRDPHPQIRDTKLASP